MTVSFEGSKELYPVQHPTLRRRRLLNPEEALKPHCATGAFETFETIGGLDVGAIGTFGSFEISAIDIAHMYVYIYIYIYAYTCVYIYIYK